MVQGFRGSGRDGSTPHESAKSNHFIISNKGTIYKRHKTASQQRSTDVNNNNKI